MDKNRTITDPLHLRKEDVKEDQVKWHDEDVGETLPNHCDVTMTNHAIMLAQDRL